MAARKLNFFLGTFSGSTDHQGLFVQAKQLLRLQRIFMDIAPPQLARHCTLGRLSAGNLTIFAANGAIAAKLKQISPSLLLKFRNRGSEVTAIRIAVQVNCHTGSMDVSTGQKLRLGRAGIESLGRLAAELSESPLRTAVESLLEKQAGQAKRSDRPS